MRTAKPNPLLRRGTTAVVVLLLALIASLTGCGSGDPSDGEDGNLSSADIDPVVVDDDGRPDGRSADTIAWDEVGPGWTLVIHEPAPIEEARTAGVYLVDPVGRRYAVAEVILGEDYVLGIQDWIPDRRAALLTRTHRTGMDENPQPSALELLDLERGDRRELATIDQGQVNVASFSRPTGKVIVFADGVNGTLERRSLEWERLSTVADEAFAWIHSPDGALVAVGTLPPSAPSRLTIHANDSGEELLQLSSLDPYRFCHPRAWWDATTLLGSCGNTGVVEPRELWLFPTDGAPPRQLLVDEATTVADAVLLPDGWWVALGVDHGLWATDDGTRLADLPNGSTIVGASSLGVVITVDGELRVIDLGSGAATTLLPREPTTVGVTSAMTLTSASFNAERPAGAGSTGDPTGGSAATPSAAPDPGQALIVVGVAGDDVLHFRTEPDPDAGIVVDVAPVAEGPAEAAVVATGKSTKTGSSTWWQVTVNGQPAWANSRYLGVQGPAQPLPDEMIGIETIGPAADFVAAIAASRPPGDAAGILIDTYGIDSISSIFALDVMGTFGDGVKGERFMIEAANIRDTVDGEEKFIGSRIMGGQRIEICEVGLSDAGQCR